ncbi:MAG: oxygen-dependent coproporphyrinogen oxidase [Prolixibacteraceae bacterium]|nr:oxygen-dependent coproporphyrinogen oxidase [Prolixibacteraceae bacterium]
MRKIDEIARTYSGLQKKMCGILESADGKGKFVSHTWKKAIGSGESLLLENGKIIEKGAVNFSFVKGKFSSKMEQLLGEKASEYAATGISSILHPVNPWVPIIHMNVRYFALDNGVSWFGGGIDLTPHIIVPEDAVAFHHRLKTICDQTDPEFYEVFKNWADDYFYLPHRSETRGVGGIFFDRIKPGRQNSFENLLNFTINLASVYPEIYAHLMHKYGTKPFSEREKKWQNLRRGRYVEFNLIYDRGTRFGLESGGNTESILASLPADASWAYHYSPEPGGFEEQTLLLLKKDIDWIRFEEKNRAAISK